MNSKVIATVLTMAVLSAAFTGILTMSDGSDGAMSVTHATGGTYSDTCYVGELYEQSGFRIPLSSLSNPFTGDIPPGFHWVQVAQMNGLPILKISFVPTAAGTYSFSAVHGGSNGNYDITLTIIERLVLDITSTAPSSPIAVGDSFSYIVNTNMTSAPSLSVSGVAWLSVVGNKIVGTPTSPGTFTVTVTASHNGQTDTQTFVLTVANKLTFESMPTGSILISAA